MTENTEEITVTLTKQFAMDLWMYLDAKLDDDKGWTYGPTKERYQKLDNFKELLADLCREDENADY